ncbi:MAG: arginine--tRNA ligase [bacterium]|nr:arginine--tRNA ligase [bacterium]
MNMLTAHNERIDKEILSTKKKVIKRREDRGYVDEGQYLYFALSQLISETLEPQFGEVDVHLSFIDSQKLGGDVAVRILNLLSTHGVGEYIKKIAPKIVEALTSASLSAEQKGLYVNVTLTDEQLFDIAYATTALADRYGETDSARDDSLVCEYSAPNAAKHLHAGHIRGTIVGEALSRIYSAVGYTVHRINHINDWGGFGAILEGYSRWQNEIIKSENKNDELYQVYLKYRELEKSGSDEYLEFKKAADAQFSKLEAGDDETIKKWAEMISWSTADFDLFYRRFHIRFDYNPGESFYATAGTQMMEDAKGNGVIVFTQDEVECAIAGLPEDLKDDARARAEDEIRGKRGALVIHIGGSKYIVVQKSDGSSIYTTRDLATLCYRARVFEAQKLVYVVGVEQTDYLRDMFAAGVRIEAYDPSKTTLIHVPIGHYLAKESGKKLSSREGALGVIPLVDAATEHFTRKYESREFAGVESLSKEDIAKNAELLAVGSVVFNDLRKEHTIPVELPSNVEILLKEFEESGGAYIMYALARARAILRKIDTIPEIENLKLNEAERKILKTLAEFPVAVKSASNTHNVAVVSNYVLELARSYNSYYAAAPVLEGGKLLYPHRAVITSAIAQTIDNALTLLNIKAPEVL